MMKILFLTVLSLAVTFCRAQNKMFMVSESRVTVQFDTTTKIFVPQTNGSLNKYSIQSASTLASLVDCYDGKIFVFSDTLISADIVQVSTSGVYKVTLHSTPLVTTKRNIVIDGVVFVYDTATQQLNIPENSYPMTVTNKTTGRISASFYSNGVVYFDVAPTSMSAMSPGLSKVVIP